MGLKFIADENILFHVVKVLRESGYEVATVSEIARFGMRNDRLVGLSAQLGGEKKGV